MPNLSTVLLSIKGEAKKASISLTSDSEITIELLQKYFKKKDAPEIVHQFQIDNKFVFVFGYLKGKKGTENKSTLPQLKTALALFGDAIIIVSNQAEWSHPVPFTVEQWINMNKLPVKQTKKEEKEDQEEDDQEEEEEEEE